MVKIAANGDSRILAEMAVQMWDSHTVDELETEFVETLHNKQSSIFIKYINDLPVGFAQCGLRTDYVDSFKFHMAMGFDEANRIICFKKKI